MKRRELRDFCKAFAYKFISSECMEKEFANLTCNDAQTVNIHLSNSLELDMIDWLDSINIEIKD